MAEERKDGGVESLAADKKFMDLFSRQIGAYGLETMAKLVQVKALIVGVKGVGMEIAKNLTLAGPKQITLFDVTPAEPKHQGANFFLSDDMMGQPIAAAVLPKLRELNSGVIINAAAELNRDVVLAHDIVVFTEGSRRDLQQYNEMCRARTVERDGVRVESPVAFISVVCMGAYGSMFSDFGPKFTIRDKTGEEPVTRIVTNIAPDGRVTVLTDKEHGKRIGIADNDHEGWLKFSDVRGCTTADGHSINEVPRFRAHAVFDKYTDKNGKERTRFNPFAVQIDLSALPDLTPYEDGGYVHQVKVPEVHEYKSLSQTILHPGELAFTDGAKWQRGEQLHMALQAVYSFQESHGSLPEPNNEEHARDVVQQARMINDAAKLLNSTCGRPLVLAVDELDEDVVYKVALHAAVELQPVATFFGGVVAQEVVKLAGKFQPLDQWLHLDWFEILPSEKPTDTAPIGSRYDNQIAVFGQAFQEKLKASTTFLVGCGALGCEMLKNFAMIGVGCGGGGTVHCTDNDVIEVSNLNRQFLFRSHNVGKNKSDASAAAAKIMNAELNVKPHNMLVMPKTENYFNDAFWESLTFVTNALDNIKAREYVDGRCVFYEKPLLESGTLGTKCNSQVVVPHLTQSYTDGPQQADDEDAIPMCTLRNFPSLIDHCIEWARAQFTDRFVQPATDAAKFCADPGLWVTDMQSGVKASSNKASAIAQALPKARAVKSFLDRAEGATFETMVALASEFFHECFRDKIQSLITAYPEDHVTEAGAKFWSGSKRFPTVATLDPENPTHLQYIKSAANILACNFGLRRDPETDPVPANHEWRSDEYLKRVLAATPVPEYKGSTTKIAAEGDDADEAGEAEAKEFETLMSELAGYTPPSAAFEPADFEKDHDFNFHIDFIHAASNLRATNYNIPVASRHKTKMIAGKIIPAIATTTASATGLVMLEMYKLLQGKDSVDDYRDSSSNLGLNSYLMMAPLPPGKAKKAYSDIEMCDVTPRPDGFTKWDKTVLVGTQDTTMRQFMAMFKEKTGLNITMLFHPAANAEDQPWTGKLMFQEYDEGDSAARMDSSMIGYMKELYAGANVVTEERSYVELEVSCADDEEEVYTVPQLVFKFK